VSIIDFPSPEEIAGEIRSSLQQLSKQSYWDRATAVETAMALGDMKDAYDHLLSYVSDPDVDAFEIEAFSGS